MYKKIMVGASTCLIAAALGGCSSGIVYDTPTSTGDETTWIDYTQDVIEVASVGELEREGGLDMIALAEKATDAPYNEVRQQVKVAIADGSWLGDATFNDMAYRNVMNDTGTQPEQLYYTDLHYFKVDVSLDTDETAKQVADNFIEAAGLTDQFGTNDEDTYDLATTDLDDELEIGNVTGYDVDHYMAVGKCKVNGEDGYWFVKVIGGWLRCYITTLDEGFVVSGNVQEYQNIITSYDDLKKNLTRLDENWVFA